MRIPALLVGTAHLQAFKLPRIARCALPAFTAAVLHPLVLQAGAEQVIFVSLGRHLPLRLMASLGIFVLQAISVPRDPALRFAALQAPFPMPRG